MLAAMRALGVVLILGAPCVVAGCVDSPYVIGRYPDAAASSAAECDGAYARALACTGFEDESLDAGAIATLIENEGMIELSSARSYRGERALHASSLAGRSVAAMVQRFEPVRSGELYVRMHVYVPSDLPTEILNVLYIGGSPGPTPFQGVDINLQDGALQTFSPTGDPSRRTGAWTVPRDAWFCLRVRVTLSDADGVVELHVDDELALRASPLDTLPDDGIEELRVGVDWSSEQAEFFEIFVDELVIDTAPVACAVP